MFINKQQDGGSSVLLPAWVYDSALVLVLRGRMAERWQSYGDVMAREKKPQALVGIKWLKSAEAI